MLKYAWKCTYFKDQSRFGRLTMVCVVFAVMTVMWIHCKNLNLSLHLMIDLLLIYTGTV